MSNLDNLPFNWFDVAIPIVLLLGVRQGRKNGLSVELLGAFKWLAIVFGCALAYGPVSGFITGSSTVFSLLAANLMAYLAAGLLIAALFAFMKKGVNGKLIGSDVFGNGEFYLGMVAGVIRFTCILFALLSLLNARYFPPAEVRAGLKYQNDVYGSDFFPTLHTVQSQVFEKSCAGPWIKNQLSWLLIKPAAPQQAQLARKDFTLP
jgi:Colicin V production protein